MADRVVIMGHGEIMQIGSARDIYRTPKNRFVAEFVGRNNILTGSVVNIFDSTLSVSTACGDFTLPKPESHTIEPEQTLSFSVSADLVTISTERPPNDNCIECTLISEEFVGSVITLFLEAKDGTELKAQVQEKELQAINPKADVPYFLSWPIQSAHVLFD